MDKEEREFLRIQTDVQILLAITLGVLALTGAFIIAYAESHNDIMLALALFLAIIGTVLVIMTYIARGKMDEPKETKAT
jgi:heme/copper-type cytochrome/quinol oxidase subunit 2